MSSSRPIVLIVPGASDSSTACSIRALAYPAPSGSCSKVAPTEVKDDQHNEVERRRKHKISTSIKKLAETVSPSCSCQKTTRAEILQRVVEEIQRLQEENKQLKERIAQLPQPGQDSELHSQLSQLLLEHILLRTVLLQHLQDQQEEEAGGKHAKRREDQQDTEASAPATVSTEKRSTQNSPAQQPWPVASLLSHDQQENHTPASVIPREEHTATSLTHCKGHPPSESHTPASVTQCEDHTSISASQLKDHTPASTSQLKDHTPASTSQRTPQNVATQRESCSSSSAQHRASCFHETSHSSRVFSQATTFSGAMSHSAIHHQSSGSTTGAYSVLPPGAHTSACPTAVHWVAQDSADATAVVRHQTTYNSRASLAVDNRPLLTSCLPTVHPTICSAVSGHQLQGPHSSQTSHPSPLTTWASTHHQASQQAIVQPWVTSNHNSTHLRHLPHSPPSQQLRMTYNHRDRRNRTNRPYHPGTRPHRATCLPPLERECPMAIPSATAAAYGQHSPAAGSIVQVYTHTAEPLPQYSPSCGYRIPPNVPPPLTAYSSPPVPSCSTRGEQRHSYPSPLPQSQGAVWRPYSDNSQSSGFCLADIISLPPSEQQLGPPPPPHNPSFLVDHLLDDI